MVMIYNCIIIIIIIINLGTLIKSSKELYTDILINFYRTSSNSTEPRNWTASQPIEQCSQSQEHLKNPFSEQEQFHKYSK